MTVSENGNRAKTQNGRKNKSVIWAPSDLNMGTYFKT